MGGLVSGSPDLSVECIDAVSEWVSWSVSGQVGG